MTSQAIRTTFTSSQWTIPRNTEILNLISSMSRSICLDIEDFHETSCDINGFISLDKIPASEFFSYHGIPQNSDDLRTKNSVNSREVVEFLILLDNIFTFCPECLILTMMYMSKFVKCSKIPLMKGNWKNIVVMSILSANRVSEINFISISDFYNIPGFCFNEFKFMEIEYLNIISYNYKLEAAEYAIQVSYLQDISNSVTNYSWCFESERVENIIKRSELLSEWGSDNDCAIYHSKAIYSIDLEEIDYIDYI